MEKCYMNFPGLVILKFKDDYKQNLQIELAYFYIFEEKDRGLDCQDLLRSCASGPQDKCNELGTKMGKNH